MTGVVSSIEDRAISLLGSNVPAEQVAHALGVTPGRISQMLAQDEFATAVALRKYETLQQHTARDAKYDSLEDQLLESLSKQMCTIFDPLRLARILQIVNAAKRRGITNPLGNGTSGAATIVQISIPTTIRQKFVTNINNQVTSAGAQDLVTIQPKTLLEKLRGKSHENVNRKGIASDTGSTGFSEAAACNAGS